ncbi:MAG TPA: class I SAM-dependent methyltransferase [Candidatus Acidoferrales bacterium]|nr:class I SAM-dependent methyltransferase [Candidatus Acidoferrales bacterium]
MPSLSTSSAPALQEGTPPGQISLWEAAYLRYETPEEEIRKFMGRLKRLGAREWPVEARIVELFCGRGNGLHALGRLGFRNLEAVDLSPRLIAQFQGAATRYVADCRHLPFAGASKDVVIVQGGLHHLPVLPGDLQQTFAEIRRVLKPEGRVMFVEPWRTPFLNFAHWLWENPVLRRLSSKLDALATMTENERTTYERWLSVPKMITGMAHEHFEPLREFFAWGKWNFLGRPRPK